jgi:transcriptional regulator with XRE-family HTH domain
MATDARKLGFVSLFVLRLFHATVTDVTKRLCLSQQEYEMIVTFSQHLEKLMSREGLSKAELARRAGLSHVAIGNYLKGRTPKYAELEKIARVFGLNPDYLLNPDKYSEPVQAADAIANLMPGTREQKDAAFNSAVVVLSGLSSEKAASYITGPRAILKKAREEKGYTPEQLAKMIGYSKVSMYLDIEEGRSQMGEKMMIKAAKILGLDVSELMSGSDHPVERDSAKGTFGAVPDMQLPPGMKAKYVPLIAMAQCGPLMAWDDGGYTGEGYLAFNPADPRAFAVTLSGDSMIPRIEPGDVALIYPSKPPKNGCVVIARLNEDNGGDVMLKLYQSNGDRITLSSYNPAYPPMQYSRADFAWIYPVAKITKDL